MARFSYDRCHELNHIDRWGLYANQPTLSTGKMSDVKNFVPLDQFRMCLYPKTRANFLCRRNHSAIFATEDVV